MDVEGVDGLLWSLSVTYKFVDWRYAVFVILNLGLVDLVLDVICKVESGSHLLFCTTATARLCLVCIF